MQSFTLLECVLIPSLIVQSVHLAPTPPRESLYIEEFENYFNEIDIEDEEADKKTRNAVNSPLQRWPNHTIYFRISPDCLPQEVANVRTALSVFNEKTCLKFKEYYKERNGEARYIYFKKSPDMCGTKVGYNPLTPTGAHSVVLSPYCLREPGVIQHETMHVLGLYHEQSRPDRDKYIQVEYSNIPQKYWSQFISYPEIYATTYNVKYDYKSLMHYSQYAFAKDKTKPSMRAKVDNALVDRKMGQIKGPSEGDLTKIKMMYNCKPTHRHLAEIEQV